MTFLSWTLIAIYLLVYFYFLHIVKNCDGAEILAHFQANKLVYHNLTCWQIKQDSWVGGTGIFFYNNRSSQNISIFLLQFPESQFSQNLNRASWHAHAVGCDTGKEPQDLGIWIFVMDSKHAYCFCSKGRNQLFSSKAISKHNYPLLWSHCIFQSCSL